jgi:hypothetical protein
MRQNSPGPDQQHPEEWRKDLNSDAGAGVNTRDAGRPGEADSRTAYDLKGLHWRLREFRDDELKQIPVLTRGARLEPGATYLDLRAAAPREFTATGNMEAGPDNWFIPKDRLDYPLWNRISDFTDPARLGDGDAEGGSTWRS